MAKARMVGINHIALEVRDLDEAMEFFGRIFEFEIRSRFERMAFLDMGDQFIALAEGRSQPPDTERHFGLVVDDLDLARATLEEAGAEIVPSRGLDFLDPSGNHIQLVEYGAIQFSKTDEVLSGMGLDLDKTESAIAELREKGMAPEEP